MFRSPIISVALLFCLVFGVTHHADGQTIRGKVANRNTGVGIGSASILLLNEAGAVQRMALSGPDGSYSIEAPVPGSYTFRVDAAGYNTHNEPPFAALAGRILELDIHLWSLTELEPVVVTAEERPFAPGPLEGFYERLDRGRGQFLTREQIEMKGSTSFTGVLRNMPGVDIVRMRGASRYTVRFKGAGRASRDCPPLMWVDNSRWGSIDSGEGPDPELFPSDIEGIEVYSPANVPADFSGIGSECGVIVVWTKRGP